MSAAYGNALRRTRVFHGLKDMDRSPLLFFSKCGGLHNGCDEPIPTEIGLTKPSKLVVPWPALNLKSALAW
jgi:hypothetical protein